MSYKNSDGSEYGKKFSEETNKVVEPGEGFRCVVCGVNKKHAKYKGLPAEWWRLERTIHKKSLCFCSKCTQFLGTSTPSTPGLGPDIFEKCDEMEGGSDA